MHIANLALAAALLAQQSETMSPPPAGRTPWQVDWGEHYCTLIRRADAAARFEVGLSMLPGERYAQMIILPRGSAPLPARITAVALSPGGTAFEIIPRYEERGGGRALVLYRLPAEFREALARAAAIELRSGPETRLRIPVTAPRQGVAALNRCTSEVAREWGIDEAALRTLQRWPGSTNNLGLQTRDYPSAALRANIQGRVAVRITVTPEGRAADCRVVGSSGNAPLDTRTCEAIRSRARFSIPLDAAGQPTSATIVTLITWSLPSW